MALPDCGGFALCWLVVRITDASTRRILTVEEKVKCAIENMTGLEVADVNIHIASVDMENEKSK